MSGEILSADGLVFGFSPGREIVRGISLTAAAGTLTAVIGPNGAGKTTLLHLLSGVILPGKGRITLNGADLRFLSRRVIARSIAVVPQGELADVPFTVFETVAMGRYPWLSRLAGLEEHDTELISAILARLDLDALAHRVLNRLSGGERRRVQLAMALAQQPSLLLMDEPTSHLDLGHQIELLELLSASCRSTGLAVLAIFHDLNLAAAYADRILLLAEGRIVAEGDPATVLTPANIARAFGITAEIILTAGGHPYVLPRKKDPPPGGEKGSRGSPPLGSESISTR